MNIIDELIDLFPHKISIEFYISSDGYGDRTYGILRTYTCRITSHNMTMRDSSGETVISGMTVLFPCCLGITIKDRYTLPIQFTPRNPIPIAIKRLSDENGLHHERVYFK